MLEIIREGTQVAEIEQGLKELSKEACGLGLQKVIEYRKKICESAGGTI